MIDTLAAEARFEQLKDDFLSAVGHELRTPLAAMQAGLGLIQSGTVDPASERGFRLLNMALSNSKRLQKMVDELLEAKSLRSGPLVLHKQPCSLQSLQEEACRRVASRLGQRELVTSAAPGQIRADANLIINVLEKILDNAIRFSADGSRIRLSIRPQGKYVVFAVEDEGIGLHPDLVDRIFEIFGRGNQSDTRRPGGAGVSLGICRYVVRQHGGHVWAESDGDGAGSSFFVALPAALEQAA